MIRVVGIGSPFGDDQVAWRVIDLLRPRLADAVELIALDRPGATLVNWMSGVDRFVLIDALQPMGSPGQVHELAADELASLGTAFSSHQFDLRETVRLAASLECLPDRMDIFGIEMADESATRLSAAAAAGALQLAHMLQERLR